MSDADRPEESGTGEQPRADPLAPDPFTLEDPEARAREERRLERERRRREGGRTGKAGKQSRGLPFGRRRRAEGDGVPPTTGEEEAVGPATGDHGPPTSGEHAIPETGEHGPSTSGEHAIPATGERSRVQRARAGVRRRLPGRPSEGAIRRRRVIAVVALIVVIAIVWLLLAFLQPFGSQGSGENVVRIPEGASASEVGQILERKGVISSGTPLISGSGLFRARLSLAGKSGDIQSGTYTLANGMSYGAAIDALTGGSSGDSKTVVIPEGYTRDQIAALTDKAKIKGNYKKATIRSNKINLEDYGAAKAPNLEGFLFPSTYELKKNAKVVQLVNQQLREFRRQFKKVDMKYASSKNLTPYDVIIVASMIDREVQIPKERKKVAEVIYNRLAAGEPLAIDATIRYATGNFDDQLTQSELAIDSPYNTRLVAGLPPTPIGNPGLAAMKAAANPSRGDARFYVIKPGTCGEHFFTGSEKEFNRAAEEYQKALEREGGSPTEC